MLNPSQAPEIDPSKVNGVPGMNIEEVSLSPEEMDKLFPGEIGNTHVRSLDKMTDGMINGLLTPDESITIQGIPGNEDLNYDEKDVDHIVMDKGVEGEDSLDIPEGTTIH